MALKKEYPGYFIAPMHTKQNKRNMDTNYLTKRMIFLERFLNGVTRSRELRNSQEFALFLSCSNDAEFTKKKNSLAKEPSVVSGMGSSFSRRQFDNETTKPRVENIENIDGQVFLVLSNHERAFYDNWNEYINALEPLYKK